MRVKPLFVIISILALSVFGLLAGLHVWPIASSSGAVAGPPVPGPGPVESIADLPVTAQYAISAALGRDNPGYHAATHADGFQLANPAQSVTARFASDGWQVQAGQARWALSLTGWGYGDDLQPVGPAVPRTEGNRVEYGRDRLTEWIVNGPLGLQHGFTLMEAPGVPGHGAPLTLALALAPAGNLAAQVDEDGRGLTLVGADGMAVLRYAGLVAYDAAGRSLPAWLETQEGQLLVRVDDAGARYPVVIDPFVQRAKLTASDGAADDLLGGAVAVDGNMVAIGTNHDDSHQGSAYVFEKPLGGWTDGTENAKLTTSDGEAGDRFGSSAALIDGTLVVGAYGDDSGTGSAYVFAISDVLSDWVFLPVVLKH